MHQGISRFLASAIPCAEVRSFPLPSWKLRSVRAALNLLRGLRMADAVILTGGSHFHDRYGWTSTRILATHWLLFRIASFVGTPVGYAGIGVGPLHTRVGVWLTRKLIKRASALMVRDSRSAAEVTTRLMASEVTVGGDLAFLLQTPPKVQSKVACIGVSLVPYFATFEHESHRDFATVHSVASALLNSRSQHQTLTAEILAFNTQGRISDLQISQALYERLTGRMPVSLELCNELDATLQRLSTMSSLIATRYHAALLGYLVGLPMIMVAYDNKCIALAEAIGLPSSAVLYPSQLLKPTFLHDKLACLISEPDSMLARVPVLTSTQHANSGLREFCQYLLPTKG